MHSESLPQLRCWFETEWPDYYGADGPGDAQSDLQSSVNRNRLPIGVQARNLGFSCIYCGTSTANCLFERCGCELTGCVIHEGHELGI